MASTPTVYNHLQSLYYGASSSSSSSSSNEGSYEDRQQRLKSLPKEMRHQIYAHISSLNGSSDFHFGKIHALDSPEQLQEAIKQVAFNVFDTISEPERNLIAEQIWHEAHEPQTNDSQQWGLEHAKEDVPRLLTSLASALGDLTPQFEMIIDAWITEEEQNQNNNDPHLITAANTIKYFLKGKSVTVGFGEEMSLSGNRLIWIASNVSSLPQVFDKEPFISRLFYFKIQSDKLKELPPEVFHLPSDCRINLTKSKLVFDPAFIANLQQTIQHNPDYHGPEIIIDDQAADASSADEHPGMLHQASTYLNWVRSNITEHPQLCLMPNPFLPIASFLLPTYALGILPSNSFHTWKNALFSSYALGLMIQSVPSYNLVFPPTPHESQNEPAIEPHAEE